MKASGIVISPSIHKHLRKQNFHLDEVGMSNAQVLLFDDYVLKITDLADEEGEKERVMMR